MAELSTLARPYAEAVFRLAKEKTPWPTGPSAWRRWLPS
jgi:F0F1-type ATP synthase, delta subunit (mitochondrial oligomycin sensitivity protein)